MFRTHWRFKRRSLHKLHKALAEADEDAKKGLREALRDAGKIVQADARERFVSIDEATARGFRVSVRKGGVAVQQSRGRTTGKRPDFGALQMREALQPALEAKEDDVVDAIDDALGRVAARFNHSWE